MINMKRIILLLLTLSLSLGMMWAKQNKQSVKFYVPIHCQTCIDKIYKTIAFEEGVKDLQCDLKTQTVVVTYDANKTNIEKLQKAFAAINKPASLTPPSNSGQ